VNQLRHLDPGHPRPGSKSMPGSQTEHLGGRKINRRGANLVCRSKPRDRNSRLIYHTRLGDLGGKEKGILLSNRSELCMTAADDSRETMLRADRICAARARAGTRPPAARPGVAEIVQSLSDPPHSLSIEEQRAQFSNPQLRADCRRLKSQSSATDRDFLRLISDSSATGLFLL
jgi:hypothetical protein